MALPLFKKIIDQSRKSVFLISLWGWGEPFLNPHIYDMISYAKAGGIRLICSTNGHFLLQTGHIDRLLDSGLDVLIVAVDGATQDTYSLYRRPGELSRVLDGVRELARRKRMRKLRSPRINIRMVVMRQNEHEIPSMIELAKSCGADMLSLKTMNPLSNDPYSLDRSPQSDADDPFIPHNPKHQRFTYNGRDRTRIRLKKNPCKRLWNNPKIHAEGSIHMCTCDVAGRFPLGNMHRESLGEIWTAGPFRRQRARFRKDWESVQPCCTCTYAYKGGSCIDEIISGVFFFNAARDE
jgi:radical SAM protein with 4Fe4S-binding SPASM domain